ncbi:MAG TPA: ParB/RepB/Spo0J family partition protein [Pyrinomonadaceae bacterium]|jgi:ParB/RepB/Spo0J family partition protein
MVKANQKTRTPKTNLTGEIQTETIHALVNHYFDPQEIQRAKVQADPIEFLRKAAVESRRSSGRNNVRWVTETGGKVSVYVKPDEWLKTDPTMVITLKELAKRVAETKLISETPSPIKFQLVEEETPRNPSVFIDLTSIVPSPFPTQERRRNSFTPEGLESLGASIVEHGLIYPIVVRPLADGRYEICVGERRWRASLHKGLKAIECFVRELSDAQVVELQYEENHEREEPNELDDAFTFKFLMDTEGYTREKLATRFHRERAEIAKILKLNDLIPEAVEEVADGRLPLKHAYYLSRFPAATQKIIVEEKYAYKFGDAGEGVVSYQDFKDEIDEHILRRLDNAPFDISDPRLHIKNLLCGDCRERSSVEAYLFPELAAADRCLNKSCFELKTNTHMKLQREAIAAQKAVEENKPVEEVIKTVALVTEKSFHNSPFGREKVQTNQNLLDQPECGFSELSLAIGGEKKGQQVYVCRNETCPVHRPQPAVEKHLQENLQRLEDEFEAKVNRLNREKIFRAALEFFTDYKPFWQFDDLIQKLIVEFLFVIRFSPEADILQAVSDWKNAPNGLRDKASIAEFVAALDKAGQSRMLFLLAHKDELADCSRAGIEKLAADYTKIKFRMLDAETRHELAPDEFKVASNLYLQQVRNGQPAEIPRFWLKEPDEPPMPPEMETQNFETVA